MMTIEAALRKEMYQLEKIIEKAKKRLEAAPKGHLRIRKWKGVVEYYYSSSDLNSDGVNSNVDNRNSNVTDRNSNVVNKNGRYLKKKERGLARDIAQRDYDLKVVKNGEERVKVIKGFLSRYEKTNLKTLYEITNPYRRELVSADMISDKEYVRRWMEVEYIGLGFERTDLEILTEKGERVRSKSEKIIADKLYLLGIPYRYEYPLKLAGNRTIYPDFTILKMPEREEVYLEHFGMMDDSDYVDSAMFKLNTYEKNGIYLGVKLFITHETKQYPLSTKALDGLVKKVFCAE